MRAGRDREALLDLREGSRGPPGELGGLPGESGGPPGGPGVIERPARMVGSCRETLPKNREWSGGPPEGSRVIGSGWEALIPA